MTDWKLELRRTWSIQADAPDDGVVHAHRLTEGARPIRVATDPDGTRHLLVSGDPRPDEEIAGGKALSCSVRSLDFGNGQETFLDIACSSAALFETFDELLASVVTASVASGDPLQAALSMLERWQDLLKAWAAALGHEHEMGLFAELTVLELLSETSGVVDPTTWRGPKHEPKDVVLPLTWIEVKAVGASSRAVIVNGLDQLADLPGTAGFLAVLTVVEDNDGRTVQDIADVLANRSTDAADFAARLVAAGWMDRSDARRWRVDGVDVVRADVCPRLTPATVGAVPAGVGLVRYQLDLPVVRSLGVPNGAAVLRTAGGR